jgi:Tol biopolymer transport system component
LRALVTARPADAAFRGANGKIFLQSTRTGGSQIFAMDPNGPGMTNVTSTRTLREQDPADSPSGLKFVYTSTPARSGW